MSDGDALTCVDCAETDRLFHHVARQRDAALAALDRVRALCDGEANSYLVSVKSIRAALDGGQEP